MHSHHCQILPHIQELLFQKAHQYNRSSFISSDPISVPHIFSAKHDIEIAAFLVAAIAWGQRKTIITNGLKIMSLMDNKPGDFILQFTEADIRPFSKFVHRTFNFVDLEFFLFSLKNIYQQHSGLESVFTKFYLPNQSIKDAICGFRDVFFSIPHPVRSLKHVSNPDRGAAAKRINMFLRWMIRHDDAGVDFGLWKQISAAHLMCPLDVHSGRVARTLGLLHRKQDDWIAVEQLTANLRLLNPTDPTLFDYALFGIGVFENA